MDDVDVQTTLPERATAALKAHFGFDSFRTGQLEAIVAVMEGKDVVVRITTGGGKSVCYLLPPLLQDEGRCLVISPLSSLKHEQVRRRAFEE